MKGRLHKIFWSGIAVTLAMTLIAVCMLIYMKIEDTRKDLNSVLSVASAWALDSNDDLQAMADEIASIAPPMRVTFLMNHGLVLADSHWNEVSQGNHANRPEVIEARESGSGDSLRLSQEQAVFTLYVARQISPHLILRLSYPIEEITRVLMLYGVVLALLFLLLYFMQHRSISRFYSDILRQMDDVRQLLEDGVSEKKAIFPEFQPAINHIAYRAARLNADMQEVTRTMTLRSEFVANASHELRSPLTSVMGFAEMLDEGLADSPEEQKLCTGMIRSECARMLHVIEDILQLSRAERGISPEKQAVDVALLAAEIRQALAPRAAQKRISIHIDGALTVLASEKAIWEILHNLMSNAIHYGKDGGFVRVSLTENRIDVQDNGIGIDKEHLPHLFEQFYRVDSARSDGGTGLGLSIVKALCEQCGASVSVESTPGEGSCFTVIFASDSDMKGESA